MQNRSHVSICGTGIVSAVGAGKARHSHALAAGQLPFRQRRLAHFDPILQGPFLCCEPAPETLPAGQRLRELIDLALNEALNESGWQPADFEKIPVYIGSSSYGIAIAEELYQNALASTAETAVPVPLDGFDQISGHLQARGFLGPDFAYNTACTASANALLDACQALQRGHYPAALVLGVELFNQTTLAGFASMQLLAGEAMQPFDLARNGLVLGEACSAVLLQADTATSGIRLCGGASRCDTHSISSADPQGSSIADVIQGALQAASLAARDIQAIKAHGTATPLNDTAEASGMNTVFAALPPFFCLKPYIGHTLGACGAVELALLAACLQSGELPASGGFQQADPKLQARPTQTPIAAADGHYMLNYFGFGGNNCSLIVQRELGT